LVLRLAEMAGRAADAVVTLPHAVIAAAQSATLVEEPVAPLDHSEHGVHVPLPPWGITTMRLRLCDAGRFPTVEGFWQL
jgi:hypothetical protein